MCLSFKSKTCPQCGQSIDYAIPLDKGTCDIVRAISVHIGKKGINRVHPRKEMESRFADPANGLITSIMVGNLTKARAHGLIAKVKGNSGNYCLTGKGARFLRGEAVPKVAIMSKVEHHQIGYLSDEQGQPQMVKVSDFIDEKTWAGINFEIREGFVVYDLLTKEEVKQTQLSLV